MSKFRSKWPLTVRATAAFVVAFASSIHHPSVVAGGGGLGGIVYDPTNWAQNSVSATQSVKQVMEAIRQTQSQVLMVKNMVDNVKGMSVQDLLAVAAPQQVKLYNDLQTGYSHMQNLQSAITNQNSRVSAKIWAADSRKLPLDQYQALLLKAKAQGDQDAAAQVAADKATLERTSAMAKQVNDWTAKNGQLIANNSAAQQTMSAQLGTLVALNSEVLARMAAQSTKSTYDAQLARDATDGMKERNAAEAKELEDGRLRALKAAGDSLKIISVPPKK